MATLLTLLRRAGTPVTDAELLDRFGRSRDESAFAELVRRHGPVVYRICRRLVGPADADDAFQSTFLVLATRLQAARASGALGGWLAGVAGRVARQMRRMAARRLRHEQASRKERPVAWEDRAADLEDQIRALDEELTRLPEDLRGPVVLCLLQGYTQEQAAAELGRDPRTLRRRLDRAKVVLRARLERRGVVPAVAAALVSGGGGALTAVSQELSARTVSLVCDFLAGGVSPSSPPVTLAKGVATAMHARKLVWTMAVVALGAMGLGVVTANNGPPGAALTPPAAPIKELAKEPVDKPTTSANEVTGLDWAKDEELAKRAVEALTRDPKAVPSVVIQSVCVHVPDGFCKRAGLTPTTPPVERPIVDQWQLSQRETRMLKGLLGAEQSRSIVHRRQLVVTDRGTGAAETLQKLNVVTDVEATTEEGAQVYTAKTVSANVGLKFKFAPQIMFTGDVHLDIKLTCYSIDIPTVVGGKRVAVFNEAGLNVTSPIPDGGTLVVKALHRGIPWQSPISIGGASLTEVRSDNTPYEMLQLFTVYATGPSKKRP